MSLSEAQKRKMEENRLKALAIREAKKQKAGPSVSQYFTPVNKTTRDEVSIIKEVRSSSVMPEPIVRPQPVPKPLNVINKSPPMPRPQPMVIKSSVMSEPKSPFSRPTSLNSAAQGKPVNNNRNFPSNVSSLATVSHTNMQSVQPVKKEAVASIFAKAAKIFIKIHLVPDNRISLGFGYNARVVDAIKRNVLSARYEREKSCWTIHVDDYMKTIETLNELKTAGLDLEVDKDSVPARVVALIKNQISKRDTQVNLADRIDQEMIDKMFPFQREGAKFAIRKNGRCLIGDDMGLGKTVQALAVASWFKEDWPVLIVCPASVAVNWKNNVLQWLSFVGEDDVEVFDRPVSFSQKKIVIISYDRLVRVVDDVFKRNMNFVILDESHNIKNSDAQRTRAALSVAKKVKRIILLSGTPALSRPMELYTQILAVNNQLFPKKHDFGARYCNARLRFMGRAQVWDYQGCSNSQELKILLESTIMIRRLKVDVLQDLPTKRRVVVELPLKLSEEGHKSLEKLKQQFETAGKTMIKSVLSDWYTESARQKVDAIVDYLDNKLKKTKKFICFGYHKVMFEAISDYLKKKNISFIIITGETPARVRQDCCDFFQNNLSCRVALVSIVAAGVGITLTAAHEVVFTELYWNPGILTQVRT